METRVRIPVTERVPVKEGPKRRVRFRRRPMAAGHVLVAVAVCLTTWTFLNADTLKRSAEASPPGKRRAAALAVLRPISAVSHALFIQKAGDAIQRALGRNPQAAPGSGSTIVTIGPKPSVPATPGSTPSVRPGVHPSPRGTLATPPGALPPLRVPTQDHPLRLPALAAPF